MSTELPSMLDLGVDIANAEAPAVLPAGKYTAEVREVKCNEADSGFKYTTISFYISPEDYPVDFDVAEAPDGTNLSFLGPYPQNEKDKRGIYNLRKVMEKLGVPFQGGKVDFDAFVGKKAIVNVKHQTYEGEVRAQISSISQDI